MAWSEKTMRHISRSVSSSWTHQRCFHRFTLSLSKVIAENCRWSLMTWSGLGVMRRGHWSQFFYSRCQFHMYSDGWECLEWFSSKRDAFNFLPLTYNGEVTKMTSISKLCLKKNYRHCFLYQSLKLLRQSFSRCSFDEHTNFLWGEVTWRDLVNWPCVTRIQNFYNICGKDAW